MNLDKAMILTASDRPIEKISCPEWGGDVYLRAMRGDDRDSWEQKHAKLREDWRGLRSSTVAAHLVTEAGEPLGFTDAEVLKLGEKNAAVLDRLFDVCQRLSGITDADIEGLEKNLPAAPSGRNGSSCPSSTGSPSPSSSNV